MRFFISRTSAYHNEQPCEEAIRVTYTRIDRRAVNDPRKIPAYRNNPERIQSEWYGEGTNHRVENGYIARDFPNQQAWAIEIDSLDQLMELHKKYGELIIRTFLFSDDHAIEIYDDYRE